MTSSVPSVKMVDDSMGSIELVTLKGDEGLLHHHRGGGDSAGEDLLVMARQPASWTARLAVHRPHALAGLASPRSLAEMAQKYGPLMFIRLGSRPCVVCSTPETAKEFLKTQDANFGSRPPTSQAQHLLYGQQDMAFHASTPAWRNLKKIFTLELTSGARVEATRHIRVDEMACMIRGIHEEKSVELKSHLEAMITNMVSRMVLNQRLVEKDFLDIVQTFSRLLGLFVVGDFIPALRWLDLGGSEAKMKQYKPRMDKFVSDILSQHRQRRRDGPLAPEECDYVHVLLDHMDRNDAVFQLSEDNVKGLMMDAFLAANDTIHTTSEWAMAELLRNPALMAKAHAELDARVGRDRVLQESDLQNLPYLQAIVKEVFRMHPAAPLLLPRESFRAAQAFGYDLPAKTRVITNVWAIGRDPSIWQEPLLFNPDRFLQPNLLHVDVRGQHFEFLPFGAGRRICPAVTMGTLVVQFAVASLLHSFDWSLPAHISPDTLDMSELFGLTLPRAAPLPCIATPRLSLQCYTN